METTYEVWYRTDDGIVTQVTTEEGIAREWNNPERAREAGRTKVREDGIAEAWVVEKKSIIHLKK